MTDNDTPSQDQHNNAAAVPASRFGRIVGFILDITALSVLQSLFVAIVGIVIPLDTTLIVVTVGGTVVTIGLYVLLTIKTGGFVGRHTLGSVVMMHDSMQQAGGKQRGIRLVPLLVWPVEGLVLLFHKHRRRLGDLWAGTFVAASGKPRAETLGRLAVAVCAVAVGLQLAMLSWSLAARNTRAFRAIEHQIEQASSTAPEDQQITALGPPRIFSIQNADAIVVSQARTLDDEPWLQIQALQTENGWRVTSATVVDRPESRSYSITRNRAP